MGVQVVGVAGARGGAGASTLAAALAWRVARRTATVLVDADPSSCGVDLLVGLDAAAGVRWPDLGGIRGDVPGADLLRALPRWGPCAVLSATPGGAPPDADTVRDAVLALAEVTGLVVVDLGRASDGTVGAGAVLVVTPRELRAVGGAVRVLDACRTVDVAAAPVVRGPAPGGMGVAELARSLGVPVVGSVPTVRGLAAAAERGGLPVRGALARAAESLARRLELGPR